MITSFDVKSLIERRRRQMLAHSFLYYRLGTSIIDDKTFDRWAYELRDLQRDYPLESSQAAFYDEFKTWDGTTGYDLPMYGDYVERVAARLLRLHERRTTKNA